MIPRQWPPGGKPNESRAFLAQNLSTVECLLYDYEVYYISPENNMFGGVGIYMSDSMNDVQVKILQI